MQGRGGGEAQEIACFLCIRLFKIGTESNYVDEEECSWLSGSLFLIYVEMSNPVTYKEMQKVLLISNFTRGSYVAATI
jgi:hypothetical protein